MTRIYCLDSLHIEPNEFYILTLNDNMSEVIIGEKIVERALKEDGDSNLVVNGPLDENDLIEIIFSAGGTA